MRHTDGHGGPHLTALRDAACAYWHRRGLHTGPGQVVTAPGAPLLLLALLSAGDPAGGGVLLSRPAADWHAVPARLLGRPVHRVPAPADCGGVPDPFVLLETVRRARSAGDDPRTLVLSVADDPTGTAVPPELLHEVCEAASGEGLLVVSDESERDTSHDPHGTVVVSPAEMLGAAHSGSVVVLTGTPSVALGRFPDTARGHGLAREVRAVLTALHARVSEEAALGGAQWFAEPPELRERRAAEAVRQGALARALHDAVTEAGALCRPPQVGRHVYADLEPARGALAAHGVENAAELEAELVRRLGAGADGGHRYGEEPGALRVRLSTLLLTGADHPEAPDPLRAPHTAHALSVLRSTLAALTAAP
ncbi:aminotransferase class I/II-fold pyridoxal phosphate-dependent enzyme [Streptomyces sp. DSM 42041]|uniref:Aminotransferase class I/II-fold pyridoxal phosphate-dependent enzyme n=1 Tax=Streptomyces hazeniae TaxID=3075538 RepID=A0ABU2NU28_9ACTN|nr:aminotransferase class I/II-fold pyridoxal phosphate-dependent enzyme [Streptomyces sp. DSM 42041]MDT0380121.1 aminotransferase class I/II-fold pyridoxal phosphate-dependent enzyme [Streptomyces sp. DSM 42041]